MPVETLPMAEWAPDMPDLATTTSIALNVTPATPLSYGPQPSLVAYSTNALDGPCVGAITVQGNDLSVSLFAGTNDKLFAMTATAPSWNNVSGSTYSMATGENWRFDLFNHSVIATDFSDELQSFSLGVSTTFGPLFTAPAWATSTVYSTLGEYVLANGNRYTLVGAGTSASSGTGPSGTGVGITDGTCTWNYQGGTPPKARYLCTPKNFLMLANTDDPVGGLGPQRIWWSASGDATTFPAPGTNAAIENMSDYNDFQGNFGEITGIIDSLANADVAIFFRHAVWRGLFVGPPAIFDFFPTENVRGCPAPNSIVPLGAMVYYLGEDGFYMFDGAQSQPIGVDKFDRWFFANVNQSYMWNVIGAPDVPNRRILWAFPSLQATDGVPDSVLIYRWDIQRASYLYLGPDAVRWLMRTLTFGYSMDGMAAAGFTDVDTLPASLDSSVWIGGQAGLGAVNGANQLAYFSGPNLAAQVATQTKQLTPGRRSYVQSSRPLVEFSSGTASVAFAARVSLYDAEIFGAATFPNTAGECPQRSDGRYHNAMMEISEGAIWSHVVGVETTFVPGGTR